MRLCCLYSLLSRHSRLLRARQSIFVPLDAFRALSTNLSRHDQVIAKTEVRSNSIPNPFSDSDRRAIESFPDPHCRVIIRIIYSTRTPQSTPSIPARHTCNGRRPQMPCKSLNLDLSLFVTTVADDSYAQLHLHDLSMSVDICGPTRGTSLTSAKSAHCALLEGESCAYLSTTSPSLVLPRFHPRSKLSLLLETRKQQADTLATSSRDTSTRHIVRPRKAPSQRKRERREGASLSLHPRF